MYKVILVLAFLLATSAYGSAVTGTITCAPFSGPTVVVNVGDTGGSCNGGALIFKADSTGLVASFSMFPLAYFSGGCQNPVTSGGCGTTTMIINFDDDLYFSQAGFADFYAERSSSTPGSPVGTPPTGDIGGQDWLSFPHPIQVAVGPGQPVHISFFTNWFGQCCAGGGPDDASVDLSISRIVFRDLNGTPSPITYETASGFIYPVVNGVAVPEPSSALVCLLGFGLLGALWRLSVAPQLDRRKR